VQRQAERRCSCAALEAGLPSSPAATDWSIRCTGTPRFNPQKVQAI